MPIIREGTHWKFKNYKVDHAPYANDPNHSYLLDTVVWNRNTDKQWFINAMEQKCIASFVQESDGEAECLDHNGVRGIVSTYLASDEWRAVDSLLTSEDYQFHGLYDAGTLTPVVNYPAVGNQGKRFEWGSSTTGDLRRSFRVMAFSNPIAGTSGGDPSDKVGQLGFVSDEPTCPTTATYDPFGQIFDRSTLQPVEGAKVVLYREMPSQANPALIEYRMVTKENTQDINIDPFLNPVSSNAHGVFSFIVPSGKYKLLALPVSGNAPDPLDYSAIGTVMDTEVTQLGTSVSVRINNAPKVLYPELYQVSKSGTAPNMLLNLPEIIEQDAPERRDISVSTLPVSAGRPIAYSRRVNAAGDNVISGQINKPFGMVTAKKQDDTVLGSTYADIDGKFVLVVNADTLPPGVAYQLDVAPVPLIPILPTRTPTPPPQSRLDIWVQNILGIFFPLVQAQSNTSTAKVAPRLNYIEGYAYDSAGAILKNAQVTILDTVLGVPVYTTQTEGEGFYKVSSEDLPRNDYMILYKPMDSKSFVSVDASKFYTQNKTYIETRKVDVNKPQYGASAQEYLTTHPEPSITNTQTAMLSPKAGVSGTQNVSTTPVQGQGPQTNSPIGQQISPALLMYVAILLLLIVGAGLLIMYYMKRKQEPHLYE
jgi:hypothetical protein